MNETSESNDKIKSILKATLFCIVFTGLFVLASLFKSAVPLKFERWAHGIIGTVVALITTWIFLILDKKSFTEIGFQFNIKTVENFFIGIAAGVLLMGFLSLSVIYFSDFKIEVNQDSSLLNFLILTLPYLPLAFMEEVGFRAYPLQILKTKTSLRNAIIITSVLFALYHIINGWAFQNAFLGAGVWGIIFGLAAVYSKGIAMPVGLHYAANITTDAFGTGSNSSSIWILKQNNGLSLEKYEAGQLTVMIPQIALLIFGIICMEWYLRKQINANNNAL